MTNKTEAVFVIAEELRKTKIENDKLKTENKRLKVKNDQFRKDFQHQEEYNINLRRRLQVLRKAIEEAIDHLNINYYEYKDHYTIEHLKKALEGEKS